eukprot:313160-Amphidinium_carterae.1
MQLDCSEGLNTNLAEKAQATLLLVVGSRKMFQRSIWQTQSLLLAFRYEFRVTVWGMTSDNFEQFQDE